MIKNAQIKSTMLGYEDHGILTCSICLDYGDSSGQSFGGYTLDAPRKDPAGKFLGRFGTAYGAEFIAKILNTVGVQTWEELKGNHIRADSEYTEVLGIGHITKDLWFYPKKDMILVGG